MKVEDLIKEYEEFMDIKLTPRERIIFDYAYFVSKADQISNRKPFDPAVNDSIKDMEEEDKAFPPDKE